MKSYNGLDPKQVLESRERYGANDLTPPARESWIKLLLSKFNDPIIKLLLFATILSFITGYFHGSIAESLGIILAIFLATFIAFINEYRAGKEFDILNKINDQTIVKVYRDGSVKQIQKNEIVVGDVVVVEQGDEVPADGFLLDSMDLKVNESTLNGESLPASKTHNKVDNYKGAYSPNNLYRGTTVSEGGGIIEVIAVGDSTEIGKTARQASELTGNETPLNKQLNNLSKIIGKVGFTIAGLTFMALAVRDFTLGVLTFDPTMDNLTTILSFFMIAVTLIVVAVPEGLAMSVTLSLAYSMRRMTANKTLVRKMHACETMGAATVICTDKTGTLTQNKMRVQHISTKLDDNFAIAIALNSTAFLEEKNGELSPIGNPTEGALLLHLDDNKYSYITLRESYKVVQRLVFSTERKYMASLIDTNVMDKLTLYIKGAPEIIIEKCNISDAQKQEILAKIKEFQVKGMRCLGFAQKEIPFLDGDKEIEGLIADNSFVFQGFTAIADPIRTDVPNAMSLCRDAGIKVKIVTGDISLTAIEIARQAGLWSDSDTEENIITGAEFEALNDVDAKAAAIRIKVMSRARPADKMRLVRLLQESGEVVAVTGDGTNDAPALNYANVGLAMGTGTAVAKEASDIILLDDSFASITTAVKWGRSIYINIQKFIQFQLTINVVALLTALIGPFIGIEFPLTVTQMLWVNLIMDTFAALALATEPAYKEVMKRKPRGINDFIVTKGMAKNIFSVGFVFLVILLGILIKFKQGGEISGYNLSMFFSIFVMLQFWNMFNARTLGGNRSAFYKIGENKSFLFIAGIILFLQIVIVEFGGEFFRTESISLKDWLVIIGSTSAVLWVGEIYRFLKRLSDKG